MNIRDSLRFVKERLGRAHRQQLRLLPRRRITRRLAVELPKGQNPVLPSAEAGVTLCCVHGSGWISQDGDCKDFVLAPENSDDPLSRH